MANSTRTIDVLLKEVPDPALRTRLVEAVNALRKRTRFGLVFEGHHPEVSRLPDVPIRRGSLVARRSEKGNVLYRVESITGKKAVCLPEELPPGARDDLFAHSLTLPLAELVTARRFGDPIYPALKLVDCVQRGGDKPWHILIQADNYHALQALEYTHKAKVDVIYIDPPYNTGARDWRYNNDYVDKNDPYRHSKWLSFMEKRLHLAKKLLKPDGVLIVTIDEKEYLHLGMLLEQNFPHARIQMISTMINPAGVARPGGFGRSDEYVFVLFFGSSSPSRVRLSREWVSAKGRTHTGNIRWDLLRRSGTNAERSHSPGCFYPIYVDNVAQSVLQVGEPLAKGISNAPEVKGATAVLPIRKNRTEGNWQWSPDTFRERLKQGRVRVGGNAKRGFVIYILKDGEYAKIQRGEFQETGRGPDGSIQVEDAGSDFVRAVPSSQWRISSHDSTQYGSRLLSDILPGREFPFPKSLYAVRDVLRFFIEDKPNAVVLDFFAGSGTTLQACCLLNAAYGGSRQSILVTNNEISEDDRKRLARSGLDEGHPDWEALGICKTVTWPRCVASINGQNIDGAELQGAYFSGLVEDTEVVRRILQIGLEEGTILDVNKRKDLLRLIEGLSIGKATADAPW